MKTMRSTWTDSRLDDLNSRVTEIREDVRDLRGEIGSLNRTIIQVGCSQLGLANWVQQIVTGGIIVAAVALDRIRSQRATA